MPAYRVPAPGERPRWCEVEVPRPRAGEVLLRMGGAGLCRTDLEIVDEGRAVLPFLGPFTLGHENAGWVESAGPGVTGLAEGEPVLVSTIKFCGRCRTCLRGFDNHCLSMSSRGLREDGGIAPFMIADRRQLVSLGSLHPFPAAPLADAGLTAFHAVASLSRVLDGEARIAIVGVGGLGALAVQFARALAPQTWVAAVDVHRGRLDDALALDADAAFLADENLAFQEGEIGHLTAVVDFVGTDATLRWAARRTWPPGAIVVCGRGGGVVKFGRESIPPGVDIRSSRGGTIRDLERVVALARKGRITVPVTPYPFTEASRAYAALRTGEIHGRAVLRFD